MGLTSQQLAEQITLAQQGKKRCSKCQKIKTLDSFYKRKRNRDGLEGKCKQCDELEASAWEKQNPMKVQTMYMANAAKTRAKKKGLDYNIDADYIRSIAPLRCPVFDVPLEWSVLRSESNNALPNSPSLDRIVPERGYVKGNVWIISHKANTIKNCASHEDLKLVTSATAKAIVDSLEF